MTGTKKTERENLSSTRCNRYQKLTQDIKAGRGEGLIGKQQKLYLVEKNGHGQKKKHEFPMYSGLREVGGKKELTSSG